VRSVLRIYVPIAAVLFALLTACVEGSSAEGSTPRVTGTVLPPSTDRCASPESSGTDPDAPVSSVGCDGTSRSPKPSPIVPTPGMADLRPLRWDRVDVAPDDRTLTITFAIGVAPCSVLDHVEVAYGASTVTITLFEGHDAAAGEVACIAIAQIATTTAVLDQPLGGRRVVDGAR
jgi:hypothetical protein